MICSMSRQLLFEWGDIDGFHDFIFEYTFVKFLHKTSAEPVQHAETYSIMKLWLYESELLNKFKVDCI